MQCPACGNALTERTVADVAVDVCDGGCGGIWFDNQELKKLDDREEAAGEELLDVAADPSVAVDHDAVWGCPRCGHSAMTRHFYSPKRAVEVDECPRCGGVWLDAGELRTIRSQYAGGAARQADHRETARAIYREQLAQLKAEFQGEAAAGAAPPAYAESGAPPPSASGGLLDRLMRFF
ncbi:MAG: zf-TFIIB domain-containing protein [Phycisphaerae bacterium]